MCLTANANGTAQPFDPATLADADLLRIEIAAMPDDPEQVFFAALADARWDGHEFDPHGRVTPAAAPQPIVA